MSVVLDKIIEEMNEFAVAESSEGGIADVLAVGSVQKGDAGFLTASEFPYIMVEVGTITPKSETMGHAGYDVLNHDYVISIMVDATEYYNAAESGNDAEGPLEDAAIAMWLWIRRLGNRRLDFEASVVRDVRVGSVEFMPDVRNEAVYARRAQLVLTVER
jgi:hypothetical protein